MWLATASPGDLIRSKNSGPTSLDEIVELGRSTVTIRPYGGGKALTLARQEVSEQYKPAVQEVAQTKAFIMVSVHREGDLPMEIPWVESTECPLDEYLLIPDDEDSVVTTFQYLGQVDIRATDLEPQELWVHKEELVAGTYIFYDHTGSVPRSEDDDPPPRRRHA